VLFALAAELVHIARVAAVAVPLWWAAGGALLLTVLITLTFRDFARPCKGAPDIVYAPAGGTVKIAEGKLVAIFMWLVTRHTVLAPARGAIISSEVAGAKRHPAMWGKASENHHHSLKFDNGIVVKMVAGFIARRVIVWAASNQVLAAGERLGLICLASRVDVILPERTGGHWVTVVHKGQRIWQGTTPIAVWVRD